MEKIDFVILWVDGGDPIWQKKRNEALGIKEKPDDIRYRDYGTLKYLFRSIENNCDWVHKIHLITDEQIPNWLNLKHPKLNIVNHRDFIPEEYLPTFNSNVIELNLFRLEALSEKFVLFNDDTFLNNIVEPMDFFIENKIKDVGIYNKIAANENFAHILLNNLIIINKYFSKKESLKKNWKKQFKLSYGKNGLRNVLLLPWGDIPGYYNHHLPQPHFKHVFQEVYQLEQIKFDKMFSNKFRRENDLNHWLFRYWNLEKGNYVPQKKKFGKYLLLTESEKLEKEILEKESKTLCINDIDCTSTEFTVAIEKLIEIFNNRYPKKSSYEK